ncbi:hypothetical protein [Yoonia vestfoldensis]|uniref:hypothetical protein n=1 Tax=Yoonia vestfoldensis TaxID=245188 RepID=UPI00035FB960|nr:hypothetical protein [Yoonia vestfoldensis]
MRNVIRRPVAVTACLAVATIALAEADDGLDLAALPDAGTLQAHLDEMAIWTAAGMPCPVE